MTDHKTVREALEDGAKRHERLIRSMAVCDTFGPSYLSQLTDSVYHKALAALDRIEAVETVTVAWVESFSASCAAHEKDFFEALAERFPHGLRIVKEK